MDDWLVGIISPIGFLRAMSIFATLFSNRVKQALVFVLPVLRELMGCS